MEPIGYTGRMSDSLKFPYVCKNLPPTPWDIKFTNVNVAWFKKSNMIFEVHTSSLRDGIWLDERVVKCTRASLKRVDATQYQFVKDGRGHKEMFIEKKVLDHLANTICSFDLYTCDKDDVTSLAFECGRCIPIADALLSMTCRLIARHLICISLACCSCCQDHSLDTKTCKAPDAVFTHEVCIKTRLPTVNHVRFCLSNIDLESGLESIMDALIHSEQLDVFNNVREWMKEANLTPEKVHERLLLVLAGEPDLVYSAISDDTLAEMCHCYTT